MNFKVMGAIALTLIICCPLALGYAFAFDEEEVKGWETTTQAPISDLLLNAETEYSIDSYSYQNNASVWQSRYFSSVGNETRTYPVEWNNTSSTYTGQPLVEEVSGTASLNSPTVTRLIQSSLPSTGISIGYNASGTDISIPTGSSAGYFTIAFTDSDNRSNYYNHGSHSFIIDGVRVTEPLSIYEITFYAADNGLYIASATADSSLGGSEDLSLILGKTCSYYLLQTENNAGSTITLTNGSLTQINTKTEITKNDGSGKFLSSTAWTGTLTSPIISVVKADGTIAKGFLTQEKTITNETTSTEVEGYVLTKELYTWGWDEYSRSGLTLDYAAPDNTTKIEAAFNNSPLSTQLFGAEIGIYDMDTKELTKTFVGGVNNVNLKLIEINGYNFLEVEAIGYTNEGDTNTVKSGDILGYWISYGAGQEIGVTYTILNTSEYTYDAPYSGAAAINVSGSNVIVSGGDSTLSFTDVQSFYIASTNEAITSLEVDTYANSTSVYAQAAYGWKLPAAESGSSVSASYWSNLQKNIEIILMADFTQAASRTIAITPTNTLSVPDDLLQIAYNSGSVAINGTDLGKYSKLQLTISGTGWTVYGLTDWPAITGTAVTYNQISGTWTNPLSSFVYLYIANVIEGTGTGAIPDVSFRIDKTSIVAGTFPSTKDLTYNPTEKFPGSYTIEVNSVGVYGDSFVFAGETFELDDNYQFTLNGRLISLRGALLTSWKQDGADSYTNAINGVAINNSEGPAVLTFNGEWSLTATQYKLETVTETVTHWKSGEFAFDKSDFGICALIVAFLTFLYFGASRPFNGTKIAFLGMVCAITAGVIISIV